MYWVILVLRHYDVLRMPGTRSWKIETIGWANKLQRSWHESIFKKLKSNIEHQTTDMWPKWADYVEKRSYSICRKDVLISTQQRCWQSSSDKMAANLFQHVVKSPLFTPTNFVVCALLSESAAESCESLTSYFALKDTAALWILFCSIWF